MSADPETAQDASHAPLGFAGFVALIAALMAMNAVATDIMLPALPQLAESLQVAAANDRQMVVSAYLLGFGVGQLFVGVLSDRFGRKPVLLWGLFGYIVFSAMCAVAQDFEILLAARIMQGMAAASPRVVVTALVRDCYSGRMMARVMSLAMMTFMAAPVLAPSAGMMILWVADWRMIFASLTLYGALVLAISAWRLPETLPVERRRAMDLRSLTASLGFVMGSRQTVGYGLASGLFFGALFGFINSAQQILAELYALGALFPIVFGSIAATIAFAAFLNSVLVGRLGMRRLSHGAVALFTAISLSLVGLASLGQPPFWAFISLLAAAMMLCGLVFSNFTALAMEPQARAAGVASSLLGGSTTLIGATAGFFIGRAYDGTIMPLAVGYTASGALALLVMAVTERGRLFDAQRSIRL